MTDVVLPPIRTPAEGVAYLIQVEREIKDLEARLKDAKARERKVETELLPALFDVADVVELELPSGAKAKKNLYIEGSLPHAGDKDPPDVAAAKEAKRAAAIEWASSPEVGWGEFVKTTVRLEFGKGDQEGAKRVLDFVRGWNDIQPVIKTDEGIHAMTLQSQAKKRLTAGKSLPLDALGLTALTAVKLTKRPT